MQAREFGVENRTSVLSLPLIMAGVILLLFLGLAAAMLVGDVPIDAGTVWDALFHYDPQLSAHIIVRDSRLPRAMADVLVGASLAVAGAIMQAVTRNPLASPGIMGLNTGASFATVTALVFLPMLNRYELILLSISGAALGAVLVYGLASLSRGGLTPVRLALTGLAVSTLLGAVGNGLKIYYEMGQDLMLWFARGTEGVRWSDIGAVWPLILVGLVGAVGIAPSVGVLLLGEHVARGLGQRTVLTKFLAAVIVVLIAGGAVSLAGPVGFVGLVVPHLARSLVGLDPRAVIPGSALLGSTLMLFADLGARLATPAFKTPVPVGVVTALVGIPFFLHLVSRRQARSREGCS